MKWGLKKYLLQEMLDVDSGLFEKGHQELLDNSGMRSFSKL
jgi:hypothetical protein